MSRGMSKMGAGLPFACLALSDLNFGIYRIALPMFACILLAAGCGKENGPVPETGAKYVKSLKTPVSLTTNNIGLVSIGILNEADLDRQRTIVLYFRSNGVPASMDGSVIYDVLVRQCDVERAKNILQTKSRPDVAFRSVWDKTNSMRQP